MVAHFRVVAKDKLINVPSSIILTDIQSLTTLLSAHCTLTYLAILCSSSNFLEQLTDMKFISKQFTVREKMTVLRERPAFSFLLASQESYLFLSTLQMPINFSWPNKFFSINF